MAADLNTALDKLKYDIRMRDWNVKQGTLQREELEKHLGSLNDLGNSCENLTLEDKEDFGD
ncbi:MAG: hypothetical protein AB7F86_06110 [Bdellovibrionales bacterium]